MRNSKPKKQLGLEWEFRIPVLLFPITIQRNHKNTHYSPKDFREELLKFLGSWNTHTHIQPSYHVNACKLGLWKTVPVIQYPQHENTRKEILFNSICRTSVGGHGQFRHCSTCLLMNAHTRQRLWLPSSFPAPHIQLFQLSKRVCSVSFLVFPEREKLTAKWV